MYFYRNSRLHTLLTFESREEQGGTVLKNEQKLLDLKIGETTNLGYGAVRMEDGAVFVRGALEGDVCDVVLTERRGKHRIGRAERIVSASEVHVEPDCPLFGTCGGCDFRHATYAHELAVKRAYIDRLLANAGFGARVEEMISPPETDRYRNKAVLMFAPDLSLGFFKGGTHTVVPADDCALLPEVFLALARETTAFLRACGVPAFDRKRGGGVARALYLRRAEASGEVMVSLVCAGGQESLAYALAEHLAARFPEVRSAYLIDNRKKDAPETDGTCRHVYGAPVITDTLAGIAIELSPGSFYQVNRAGAELLYAKAAAFADIGAGERVCDLYCGTGTIGMMLAKAHPEAQFVGVELVEAAVRDANRNREKNALSNIEFLCMDAKDAPIAGCDVAVVDPPRRGLSPEMTERLIAIAPRRIVAVSCSVDTLVRDLVRLRAGGYDLCRIAAVNLFPRTAHCECVAMLTRHDELPLA